MNSPTEFNQLNAKVQRIVVVGVVKGREKGNFEKKYGAY